MHESKFRTGVEPETYDLVKELLTSRWGPLLLAFALGVIAGALLFRYTS